jgi:hypothetical protein
VKLAALASAALLLLLLVPQPAAHALEERAMAVLKFDSLSTSYVTPVFGNYFEHGDVVKLKGLAMLTGTWKTLDGAKVHVQVVGPDGSRVVDREMVAGRNGAFSLSISIAENFRIGKYVASATVSSGGYRNVDNEYLTEFYIMQICDHAVSFNGKDHAVHAAGIGVDTSNARFETAGRTLSIDVKKVAGAYSGDGNNGYPGPYLFLVMDNELLKGSFFHKKGGDSMVYWDSWLANSTHSIVQIHTLDVQEKTRLMVGTYEMSEQ